MRQWLHLPGLSLFRQKAPGEIKVEIEREKPDEQISDRYCHDNRARDASQRPTQPSTAANEGLQHPGERHDRRRPQELHEFMP